jgi:hypothetical protein
MESRKALARKKDNDVLKDMVGRAKSLKVIPEELSLLVHRIAHGDPPAKGDSELDTKETLQDPRRLSSQIRWVKYGSFPFWPGRFFPQWDEAALPDYVRNAKHKSNRRAIYLFGLDMHAWIVPRSGRIKAYRPSRDPNLHSVDGNGLFEQGKQQATQCIADENEERRRVKNSKEHKERMDRKYNGVRSFC